MNICKKISYLVLIIATIIINTACQSNNNDNSSNSNYESTDLEIYNENINNVSENDFEEYNILTFDKIEINKNNGIYSLKVKVTNNSNEIIRTITPTFSAYDNNENIINSAVGVEPGSLKPNKSCYIETSIEEDPNIKDIKISLYSYNIKETIYNIDLISELVEIY